MDITIKLDKERKIRFSISAQMKIEKEFNKRIHELFDPTVEELTRLLYIGLDDPSLTYEQLLSLLDQYDNGLTELLNTVIKALMYAQSGKKGLEAFEKMEKLSEEIDEKNLSGPVGIGMN